MLEATRSPHLIAAIHGVQTSYGSTTSCSKWYVQAHIQIHTLTHTLTHTQIPAHMYTTDKLVLTHINTSHLIDAQTQVLYCYFAISELHFGRTRRAYSTPYTQHYAYKTYTYDALVKWTHVVARLDLLTSKFIRQAETRTLHAALSVCVPSTQLADLSSLNAPYEQAKAAIWSSHVYRSQFCLRISSIYTGKYI